MPGIEPGSTAPSLGRNYNNIVIIRHTYLCVKRSRPTTLFDLTAKSFVKLKHNHECYKHSDGTSCGPGHVTLTHVINSFLLFHRYEPKNQITNNRLSPPAKILRAPICWAFCSAVHNFFQYLFIVRPFFDYNHGINQNTNHHYRSCHAHASCILLWHCCLWADFLWHARFRVAGPDRARAAVGHSPICPTPPWRSSIVPLVVCFVVPR